MPRSMSLLIAGVFTTLLIPPALAGTILHSVDGGYSTYDAQVLSGQSEHDSVGLLTSKAFLCSGTLIDSEWVLTAAHCVDSGAAKNLTFTLGGESHTGVERIPHPNWTGDLGAGWDIGLLKLKTPANANPATLATTNPVDGIASTAVGFGRTGTGLTGAIGSAGTKHAGHNTIDANGTAFGWSERILLWDFDSPSGLDSVLGSMYPVEYEYETAPGDSGGALFVGGKLAGVVSLGWAIDGNVNSDYGDGSGFTNVTAFGNWISDVINGTDSGGGNKGGGKDKPSRGGGRPFGESLGLAVHNLTAPVPEPSSLVMVSILGLFLVIRRSSVM